MILHHIVKSVAKRFMYRRHISPRMVDAGPGASAVFGICLLGDRHLNPMFDGFYSSHAAGQPAADYQNVRFDRYDLNLFAHGFISPEWLHFLELKRA